MSGGDLPGMVILPVRGTWRFRRKARLAVEAGALVVTDRGGRTKRFPLDGSDNAPARYETLFGTGRWVLLDGKGETLATGEGVYWDYVEVDELLATAGIFHQVRSVPPPPPPLRPDGVKLEDATWPWSLGVLGPVALALTALTRLGVLPGWLGLSLGALVLLVLLGGLATGILSKPRRGKGWAAMNSSVFEGILDNAREGDAREWSRRKRLNAIIIPVVCYVVLVPTYHGDLLERLRSATPLTLFVVALSWFMLFVSWRRRQRALKAVARELGDIYTANPSLVPKPKRRARKGRSLDA